MREAGQTAKLLSARAALLNASRLAAKTQHQYQVGREVEAAEAKLPKTSDSLSQLGAGKPYGGT